MSTRKIREALDRLALTAVDHSDELSQRIVAAAWPEVEAIENACLVRCRQGVVHNELGEKHETTPALDAAADHLMSIGMEQLP